MPNLVQGHQYLLLISHFSGDDQSGYKLSFGGRYRQHNGYETACHAIGHSYL